MNPNARSRGRYRMAIVVGLLVLPLLMVSCTSKTTAVVRGKVLQKNGEPLPGGSVTFYATDNAKAQPQTAQIKFDGTYEMPQAPVGNVKVTVSNLELMEGGVRPPVGLGGGVPARPGAGGMMGKGPPKGAGGPPKDAIKDAQTPPGWEPPPKPEGKYVPINKKYQDAEQSGLIIEVKSGEQNIDIILKD